MEDSRTNHGFEAANCRKIRGNLLSSHTSECLEKMDDGGGWPSVKVARSRPRPPMMSARTGLQQLRTAGVLAGCEGYFGRFCHLSLFIQPTKISFRCGSQVTPDQHCEFIYTTSRYTGTQHINGKTTDARFERYPKISIIVALKNLRTRSKIPLIETH